MDILCNIQVGAILILSYMGPKTVILAYTFMRSIFLPLVPTRLMSFASTLKTTTINLWQ